MDLFNLKAAKFEAPMQALKNGINKINKSFEKLLEIDNDTRRNQN